MPDRLCFGLGQGMAQGVPRGPLLLAMPEPNRQLTHRGSGRPPEGGRRQPNTAIATPKWDVPAGPACLQSRAAPRGDPVLLHVKFARGLRTLVSVGSGVVSGRGGRDS